jgi:hypothetical protein
MLQAGIRQIFESHWPAVVEGGDFQCGDGQHITRTVKRDEVLPMTYELPRKKRDYSGVL